VGPERLSGVRERRVIDPKVAGDTAIRAANVREPDLPQTVLIVVRRGTAEPRLGCAKPTAPETPLGPTLGHECPNERQQETQAEGGLQRQ
jgi:hypothetical protein